MQRGFRIGLPEVKFGVPAPLFFPGAAVNCVGQRAAELAVLSGKMYTPEEAARINLVDAVGDSRFAQMRTVAKFCTQQCNLLVYPGIAIVKQLVRIL